MRLSREQLQELPELIAYMSEDELRELDELLLSVEDTAWVPFEGPQLQALESKADILFYGGAAGGGKTDLVIGAAITQHTRSIVFRREFAQLKGIRERASEVYEPFGKFNGQHEIWRLSKAPYEGRTVEFGACQNVGDEKKYQGRPHDLKAFDEITHFLEMQFRFLITWRRTTKVGQRARVIVTGNPPTDAEGDWVIKFWGPWLDPLHPNPAQEGELRWYISDAKGEDLEVPDDTEVWIPRSGEAGVYYTADMTDTLGVGGWVKPLSRTFIRASVEDNPALMATGYKNVLQSLPEPLRSQMLLGDFSAGRQDSEWQVIPTAWVLEAQSRWRPTYREFLESQIRRVTKSTETLVLPNPNPTNSYTGRPPEGVEAHPGHFHHHQHQQHQQQPQRPLTEIELETIKQAEELARSNGVLGVDVARGGSARTVLSPRLGLWFAQLHSFPGRDTPDGRAVIDLLVRLGLVHYKAQIDVGGVGSSPVDLGRLFNINVVPMNGANKSIATDRSGKLGFVNQRAEWYWGLREALDPDLGIGLALPPDSELLADLTSARWFLKPRGILVEEKHQIRDRIGRSTDKGDAVVLAHATPMIIGEGYMHYYEEISKRVETAREQEREQDRQKNGAHYWATGRV